jgi:hypothetical protein
MAMSDRDGGSQKSNSRWVFTPASPNTSSIAQRVMATRVLPTLVNAKPSQLSAPFPTFGKRANSPQKRGITKFYISTKSRE